ncbi:50S ribosomal protein L11 methyltransferase [Microbispora sp. H10830]|uniref:50S ribosomal protein L11 methyltransferase n=1 Tax=Microbispora sp. H10830 TaxID=2729109 RepID=UPI0015FEC9C3|nr:50S ribosomal protein L11 methyltransferase [Microbispora sp. H10830]
MTYRHATVRGDYADLASGAVLHSAPGFPAFPVRLATEMFLRAMELRGGGRATVWDPCCGSGYLLTVIGLLHRRRISAVLASDIDPAAVGLAERNLALLTRAGLAARAVHLAEQAERWGRASHTAAAEAAHRIASSLSADGGDVPNAVYQADVFDADRLLQILDGRPPDVVITDVPYSEQTSWHGPNGADGVAGMLNTLGAVLGENAVIAVAVRGRKAPRADRLRTCASFRIGTRTVALLRPQP